MVRYLNLKTSSGVETVDQLDSKDFNTYQEFKAELRRLVGEYLICSSYYAGIYISQRGAK